MVLPQGGGAQELASLFRMARRGGLEEQRSAREASSQAGTPHVWVFGATLKTLRALACKGAARWRHCASAVRRRRVTLDSHVNAANGINKPKLTLCFCLFIFESSH